jgi:hypothetical protein
MNKDIRIDLSFSNHRKRKKLFSTLGAQGVLSLIDLWLKTAENRPKGILFGMDETDIALDAQWPGDPAQFCQALVDTGFLERDEKGIYSVHDWKGHQRYAYFAEERSQRAREAVEVRWSKRDAEKLQKECGVNTERIQTVYGENIKGNTPSPSPSPLKTLSEKKNSDARVKEFFDFWGNTFLQITGQPHVFSFAKDGKLVKDLLKVHPLELLKDTCRSFFRDERCKHRGLTIGIFYQEINRLLGMKAMDPLAQAERELGMSIKW